MNKQKCESTGCSAWAEYDARTKFGPWAFLCPGCFKKMGLGKLGEGFAQHFPKKPDCKKFCEGETVENNKIS